MQHPSIRIDDSLSVLAQRSEERSLHICSITQPASTTQHNVRKILPKDMQHTFLHRQINTKFWQNVPHKQHISTCIPPKSYKPLNRAKTLAHAATSADHFYQRRHNFRRYHSIARSLIAASKKSSPADHPNAHPHPRQTHIGDVTPLRDFPRKHRICPLLRIIQTQIHLKRTFTSNAYRPHHSIARPLNAASKTSSLPIHPNAYPPQTYFRLKRN